MTMAGPVLSEASQLFPVPDELTRMISKDISVNVMKEAKTESVTGRGIAELLGKSSQGCL